VAFGSDFNGIAGHVGPRFGTDACGGAGSPSQDSGLSHLRQLHENNRLQYPFTIDGFGTFDKQVTGKKTFDFTGGGLAHGGLLPDMAADMKGIGLSDEQLEPLFRSAEGYIRVGGRAEGIDAPAAPTAAACVDRTVTADATCKASASVASD